MPAVWLLLVTLTLEAQTLLARPEPSRLVNDYAGVLSASEVQSLENKLVAFNDSTSNQIAVVIVNDLQGYDRSEFAYKVAKDWGVGQGDFNNGLLVLVKTKTETRAGQIFIATGYGLEGAIPDIACADIIDREILPRFRENNYYGGLDAGTDVLMALAAGEYTYGNYAGEETSPALPGIIFFIMVIMFIVIVSAGSSNNKHLKKGRFIQPASMAASEHDGRRAVAWRQLWRILRRRRQEWRRRLRRFRRRRLWRRRSRW
ncbi:MAG: TPM domain-containing protein [Marinilabiliales bacterium]|nr:TPM domain-containing protein [Marinilabiliales bacterium]